MKLYLKGNKKYFLEEIHSQELYEKVYSSIANRSYFGGYSIPFTAFVPLARWNSVIIGLKTYPGTISTPFIVQGTQFDGPFMLHMLSDYGEKMMNILKIARTWGKRKEDYMSVTIPEGSVTEEISASPVMMNVPPQFLKFSTEYFERLMEFEENLPAFIRMLSNDAQNVENYTLDVSSLVRSLFKVEPYTVENYPCVEEVEVEKDVFSIEIPFQTGSIMVFYTMIDRSSNTLYKMFRIEPKIFGAVDFEIFLLEFAKRKREVENIFSEVMKRIDMDVEDTVNAFFEYYLSLATTAASSDELIDVVMNVEEVPDPSTYMTIKDGVIQFRTEAKNCEQGKKEIKELQNTVFLRLLEF